MTAQIIEKAGKREFPPDVREILEKITAMTRKATPKATETISYHMPVFALDGRMLVYFAAFKKHIGLYPPVRGDAKLVREVAPHAGEKGNRRFPFDRPIAYPLIARIVRFKAKQLGARTAAKKKPPKAR